MPEGVAPIHEDIGSCAWRTAVEQQEVGESNMTGVLPRASHGQDWRRAMLVLGSARGFR